MARGGPKRFNISAEGVKIVISPDDIRKVTEEELRLIKERTPLGLQRAGSQAINRIEDRLDRGKGYQGNLKPYSPHYLLKRKERGATETVNLTWSGNMRSAMAVRHNERYATIYFNRSSEAKKAAMLNKTRPFFGFTRQDEKELAESFAKYVFRGFK